MRRVLSFYRTRSLTTARPPIRGAPPSGVPRVPAENRGAAQVPPPPKGILDLNGRVVTSARPQARPASTSPAPSTGNSPVIDVTSANFQASVLGSPVAVILQATAGWCEPCKKLSPVLERAARASRGVLVYARLDVDAEADLAGQLGVRSLPTVWGIVKGKAVDTFQGLPADERLRGFLEAVITAAEAAGAVPSSSGDTVDSPLDAASRVLFEALEALENGKPEDAEAPLRSLLQSLQGLEKKIWDQAATTPPPSQQTPGIFKRKVVNPVPKEVQELSARTLAALVRVCLRLVQQGGSSRGGDSLSEKEFALGEEAKGYVGILRKSYKSQLGAPEIVRALVIQSAMECSLTTLRRGSLEVHRSASLSETKSASARLLFAQALLGIGKLSEAVEVGLEAVKLARGGGVGGDLKGSEDVLASARGCVLAAFEILGPKHESVVSGRKSLTRLVF